MAVTVGIPKLQKPGFCERAASKWIGNCSAKSPLFEVTWSLQKTNSSSKSSVVSASTSAPLKPCTANNLADLKTTLVFNQALANHIPEILIRPITWDGPRLQQAKYTVKHVLGVLCMIASEHLQWMSHRMAKAKAQISLLSQVWQWEGRRSEPTEHCKFAETTLHPFFVASAFRPVWLGRCIWALSVYRSRLAPWTRGESNHGKLSALRPLGHGRYRFATASAAETTLHPPISTSAVFFFLLRAPFGQYGPVAATWALFVYRSRLALDQGGVEPRQAVSPKALRPWTIPLRYSVG